MHRDTPLALQSIFHCSHSQHPARGAWQHPTLTGLAVTFPRVHRDWPPLISFSHAHYDTLQFAQDFLNAVKALAMQLKSITLLLQR